MTTLLDNIKFNIDFIKEAYHKRWQIEIHFKQLKEETILTNLKAKTYKAIELDLQIIHFMNILNSFIKYTIEKHLLIDPINNQINYKNCFNLDWFSKDNQNNRTIHFLREKERIPHIP